MQPRPSVVPPGAHQSTPSPVVPPQHHQQQQMSAPYPPQGMRRQGSAGSMNIGGFSIPPQSPQAQQQQQGSYPRSRSSGFHQMHSPVHQQTQRRGSMQMPPQQQRPQHLGMQRGSSQSGSGSGGMQPPSEGRQQQYNPTVLNGNWQSDKDMPHRREMIQRIVKMLKKDKNGTPDWLNKLPHMAKQLEVSLYRTAQSFKAYMDMTTLKHRLQMIATEVSRKAAMKKYIDTMWESYLGLPHRYSGGNRVSGNEEHIEAALRVNSLDDLEHEPELKSLWLKTEILLKAATGYNLETDGEDEWLVLHAIAQLDCLTAIMWFALRLYPEQATMRRSSDGNTPLHIAATQPMYAMQEDPFHGPPIVHEERTMYPLALQSAQDFMAVLLARAAPHAATYMNDEFHTPLVHCIHSYPRHCRLLPNTNRHVHSPKQYQLRLKELIGAAPQALASRDLVTKLYPFQTAAVEDAPLDFIYTLFRGDPSVLKYRRLTKREADYERVLEENASLKKELETQTKYIQELQNQLKESEKKDGGRKNSPARKRTKRSL